jgi:alpha-L-fucosidase
MRRCGLAVGLAGLLISSISTISTLLNAQQVRTYEATVASLDTHPVPAWYDDAKLGIFVVWGLYSVPGWAPLAHPGHDFFSTDYLKNMPYAEWYSNEMRYPGTPTQAYHAAHYGKDFGYYQFEKPFNAALKTWNPDKMAQIIADTGARYIVLTAKFHDGYMLWPSQVKNPDQQDLIASRDVVGDLGAAVEKRGIRLGLYYSGGYDWTFNRGPIEVAADYEAVKPESQAYGEYADAQLEELIAKYHPAVVWNDIDWPKTGKPLKLMADYYNAVPDGVVDDRFGVKHADFETAEYRDVSAINPKKWEACRGLGASFGYNRAEGEAQTIAPDKLIALLVDTVSKNGNLLLDVGPEADGTIPPVQMERLRALGAWMKQNGEAIYGTRPWTRAEGNSDQGIGVRFTRKSDTLYATLLGRPSGASVVLKGVSPKPGSAMTWLGSEDAVHWTQEGPDVRVSLPSKLAGNYAFVVKMQLAQ